MSATKGKLHNASRKMNLSSFQFHPQPLPTLVTAASFLLLLALGFWQLDRAEQKRALASIEASSSKLPPLVITAAPLAQLLSLQPQQSAEYRTVIAKGVYLADKTVLIENRKYRGNNGFHVITPLNISGSDRYLLVNRGWIPTAKHNSKLVVPTPTGPLKVTGEARIPAPPPLRLFRAQDSSTMLQRWPYLALDDYESWSALKIYPFVILQDKGDPHGFVRAWPAVRSNDAMHTGYAVQWFAFALIAVFIWFKLSLASPTEEQP